MCTLAGPREPLVAWAPLSVQFLSFLCSFCQKSGQIIGLSRKFRGWRPRPRLGKSWIRRWCRPSWFLHRCYELWIRDLQVLFLEKIISEIFCRIIVVYNKVRCTPILPNLRILSNQHVEYSNPILTFTVHRLRGGFQWFYWFTWKKKPSCIDRRCVTVTWAGAQPYVFQIIVFINLPDLMENNLHKFNHFNLNMRIMVNLWQEMIRIHVNILTFALF